MIYKAPPNDIHTEKTVLGSMLYDISALNTGMDVLSESCFYSSANRTIFTCIEKLYSNNSPIDVLTLADELNKKGQLESIGGEAYLSELESKVATSLNIESHCNILNGKRILRELIRAGNAIVANATACDKDEEDILVTSQNSVYEIGKTDKEKNTSMVSAMVEVTNDIASRKYGEISGITTGIEWLNDKTGGLQKGDLILIGGRPGSGKTALEAALSLNLGKRGIPHTIYSLEMNRASMAQRMVCIEAEVNLIKIKKSICDKDEHERIRQAISHISTLPINIDDCRYLSVSKLRGKLRRQISEYGIKVAFIDHWHLLDKDEDQRHLRGYEIIQSISRKLKLLAGDLGIPIIPLVQLSRESARLGIKSHRPTLADIRDAGEQDADLVVFTHREEMFPPIVKGTKTKTAQEQLDEWKAEFSGKAEMIIAKHRNGPTGSEVFGFKKEFAKFYELTEATDEVF